MKSDHEICILILTNFFADVDGFSSVSIFFVNVASILSNEAGSIGEGSDDTVGSTHRIFKTWPVLTYCGSHCVRGNISWSKQLRNLPPALAKSTC